MAISSVYYVLIRRMYELGLLPQNAAILEIGEANINSDVPANAIDDDIRKYVTDPERRDQLLAEYSELAKQQFRSVSFDLAKLIYRIFFAATEVQSIDFNGTISSHKLDLNVRVQLNRKFDVSLNHGTAEHIFNIAQVFRTMHDYTVPGGLMIHEGPFTGWIDHGFYNLQPTLFFDVAEFNQYEIRAMVIEDHNSQKIFPLTCREDLYELAKTNSIPANTMLFVAFRKGPGDAPFKVPLQGYYRGILPASGVEAWQSLR